MSAETSSKLRINLAGSRCNLLRISTNAKITKNIANILRIDPKHRFTSFYEQYIRDNINHFMTLRLARQEINKELYSIRLSYEIEGPITRPEFLRRSKISMKPSEAFTHLCNLEPSFTFRCSCWFLYKRTQEKKYFVLPIKAEDQIFDEIRGIRLVKLEQDRVLFENTIDLVDFDTMEHKIIFVHEGTCSLDLPQRLLKQAKMISRRT